MLKEKEEIVSIILDSDGALTIRTCTIRPEASLPKPLIIGSSAVSSGSSIVILGGGAVCFSFGAFWNSACFTLDFIESIRGGQIWKSRDSSNIWRYFETFEITTRPELYNRMPSGFIPSTVPVSENLTIPRKRITSPADFVAIVYATQPTILEGLELGKCTEIWTDEYLKERIGVNRKVRIPTLPFSTTC
jgi:tRNA wybutosine-synthesizing protein 4